MDYKAASEKLRAFAATIVEPDIDQKADRLICLVLQQAAFDAVRDEWQNMLAANPELKKRAAIAMVVMADAGYDGVDAICSQPGLKPMIAKVNGQECVAWDYSLGTTTPLSAIYTNAICEILDAAEKVATQLREAAEVLAAKPPEPPQTPQSE